MRETARILLVDDNEPGRYALARCLRHTGHHVTEVATGQDCLTFAATAPNNLIVLDVKLPDISGTEVCRQLKSDPRTAGIPVIQISAHFTSSDHRVAGMDSGADAYFCTPFEISELLAQIDVLLRARQTEEALRQSEARYRLLFDRNPDGVFSLDPTGRLTMVNPACEKISGYSQSELLQQSFLALCAPDCAAATAERFLQLLRHPACTEMETAVFRKDGTRVDLEVTAESILSEGRVVAVHGTAKDITERKARERAVQHTIQRAGLLSETAGSLLASTYPQSVVEDLCRKVMAHLNCDVFFNFLAEEASGRLKLNACAGILEEEMARIAWLEKGVSVCGCVARDSQRIIVEDVQHGSDPRAELVRSCGVQAYCCHPLLARGQLIGTLGFGSRQITRFAPEDIELMGLVADQVSVAMDRMRAEEALRLSESFYRQTLESIPGMVFTTRPDGYCDYQSQQWVDYTGVPMTQHLGSGWNTLLHPEDRARAAEAWRAAVDGRASYDLEYRVRRHDGNYEWFKVIARPIRDTAGQVVRWFGVAANIHELKQAQEAQLHAVERYERQVRLFEGVTSTTPDFVYLLDLHGRYRYANRRLLEVWGMPLPDVLGKTWIELGYEQWLHDLHVREIAQVIQTKRPVKGEVPFKAPVTGVFGIYEYILTPVIGPNGEVELIAGTTRDVTERKRAEQAIDELAKQRELALNAAQLGWWHYDPATDIASYDQRFCKIFGVTGSESQNKEILARLYPEDLPGVWSAVEAALKPADPKPYAMEYRIRHPDGSTRWIEAHGVPTFAGEGQARQAVGFVGTVQDITERKTLQMDLERLVNDRTAKLQELVGELEHFSYTITHDMRAPLRAMRGFAELIHELCGGCVHDQQKTFVDRIIASAERMDLLITDALSYSKTVRQELPLGPVEVRSLLRGMLDSYPEFQTTHARISVAEDLPWVLGNQAGLTQCFSNLLGNAIKFVAPGQVPEIMIRAEFVAFPSLVSQLSSLESQTMTPAPMLGVPASAGWKPAALSTHRPWVRLWVEDNGIGISEKMLPRVFHLFSRGISQHEGTGIGLALVRKVVDRMGGRVGVESEPGKGSRFWIELPSAEL